MPQRKKFTQSVPLPQGTVFSVEVEAESGYTPGRPNISQGVIEKDITIQATPATPDSLIVTSTIYEAQDITISIYDQEGTRVTRTYTNEANLSLPYNTKYSVKLTAHEGFIKSELINIIEGRIYTLTRNTNISAKAEATAVPCAIVVNPTQHQTITVTTDNGIIMESDPDDEVEALAPYWTHYTGTVDADPGYFPGVINVPGEQTIHKHANNFHKYTEDPLDESGWVEVEASSATLNLHELRIDKYDHQAIHAFVTFEDETTEYTYDSEGAIRTYPTYKVFEVFDSSTLTVSLVPNEGYQSIYPSIKYSDGTTVDIVSSEQEFTIDANIELMTKYPDASIKYHTITLNQSRDEMIYLNSGEYEDITGSVTLKYGSTINVRAVSLYPSLYRPGEVIATGESLTKVSENNYTGTVTGDNTIYITPVSLV